MPDIAAIGILAGGVISLLLRCVLPLVPGYPWYVVGRSLDNARAYPSDMPTPVFEKRKQRKRLIL